MTKTEYNKVVIYTKEGKKIDDVDILDWVEIDRVNVVNQLDSEQRDMFVLGLGFLHSYLDLDSLLLNYNSDSVSTQSKKAMVAIINILEKYKIKSTMHEKFKKLKKRQGI